MSRHGHAIAPPEPFSAGSVALCGLLALAAAVGIGRFALTPILPMMQDDFRLTVAQGGWLASGNYVGYLIGALWATFQRAAAHRAIRASLTVTALATLAMAYAEGVAAWLGLRLLAGVSSAWALIHVTSWCVGRLAPLGRRYLVATVFAGVGAGISLAGALCLALMAAGGDSRDAWLALGAAALLITLIAWPVLGRDAGGRGSPAEPRHRWSANDCRLVACYGAFGLGYIIPATFLPMMGKQAVPDPAVFGWAWPIFGAAAVVSTLGAAALLRALSNRTLWRLAALLMALGVASPAAMPGVAGIAIAALFVGGTFMVITMAAIQEARATARGSASALVAAMTAAFAAGQIVGPLLVSGWVPAGEDFAKALLVAFVVLLASVAGLALPSRPAA